MTTKLVLVTSFIWFCRMARMDTPFAAANLPIRSMMPSSSLKQQQNRRATFKRERCVKQP